MGGRPRSGLLNWLGFVLRDAPAALGLREPQPQADRHRHRLKPRLNGVDGRSVRPLGARSRTDEDREPDPRRKLSDIVSSQTTGLTEAPSHISTNGHWTASSAKTHVEATSAAIQNPQASSTSATVRVRGRPGGSEGERQSEQRQHGDDVAGAGREAALPIVVAGVDRSKHQRDGDHHVHRRPVAGIAEHDDRARRRTKKPARARRAPGRDSRRTEFLSTGFGRPMPKMPFFMPSKPTTLVFAQLERRSKRQEVVDRQRQHTDDRARRDVHGEPPMRRNHRPPRRHRQHHPGHQHRETADELDHQQGRPTAHRPRGRAKNPIAPCRSRAPARRR